LYRQATTAVAAEEILYFFQLTVLPEQVIQQDLETGALSGSVIATSVAETVKIFL